MKEKRIFAMFITSAVTLVASLAVTFGVLMTLADPVVATGITRYEFAFGVANNSNISYDGNTTTVLKLQEDVVFQPTSALAWNIANTASADDDTSVNHPVWFAENISGDITFLDESISTRVKVIPFKVVNATNQAIDVNIDVVFNQESNLTKYTFVKIYNFADGTFDESNHATATIPANTSVEYAVVVLADDTDNVAGDVINWGTDFTSFNVKVTNTTISE